MTVVAAPPSPHVLSRRAARGLDDHATPHLAQAARVWRAGIVDLDRALAHCVLAARATVGASAPDYTRERVHSYVDSLADTMLDGLADALVDAARREQMEAAP